ncbi:HAD-IC family P-type ATPase [Candidatus Kaiserbacteria bacterium]|nr:HAD-IC family P-type ATPase [Candidatus Kaiserbacteria bacterium]
MQTTKQDVTHPHEEVVPYHALPVETVRSRLRTPEDGLTEEMVLLRRKEHGANAFTEQKGKTLFGQIFEQLRSPLTVILLLAAVVTLSLQEYVDATVIAIALAIAVVIGVLQEGRASRAFEKLSASQSHTATVFRNGKRHEIPAAELVPGDIVVLQSGMQVPADIRFIETRDLTLNEAALTGEWLPVWKDIPPVSVGTPFAERHSMGWKGTFVVNGYGQGVVVATGDKTEVGQLAESLSTIEDEVTPLQREMQKVSRLMFYIIIVLVAVIFAIGVLHNVPLETMLLTSVAIAVASIPEGLPAAVTIVLAVAMEALLNRGGLVRNLLAAETLGSTTFVLTDKTGTLTKAHMTLTDIVYQGGEEEETTKHILTTALSASDAYIDEQDSNGTDNFTLRGEPMERAILEKALDMGVAKSSEEIRRTRSAYLAFTSENRFAAGINIFSKNGTEGYQLCVNGAPEYILEAATDIGEKESIFYREQIQKLTEEGKRIIAVGHRSVSSPELPEDADDIMKNLTFAGLLVFDDPIREGVDGAIKGVQEAGAEVRLVTGDNPETALSIARAVGIAGEHDIVMTGKDIAEFSDEELYDILQTVKVFARVLPKQKLRLAEVLQKHDEVVAMTGDGVNDAPALQKANIGVALGSGTEVAQEASDLILVNDGFDIMYAAIEEGRRIIANLRKIVAYLLSTSLTEVALIGTALLVGAPIPLLPAQILWANIIEEGFMSVAFSFEPGDKNAMKMRPEHIRKRGIITKEMLEFIGLVVVILSTLLVAFYLFINHLGFDVERMRSIMFLSVAVDSLFIAFLFRSLDTPFWHIPFYTNKFFLGSFGVSILLLILAITLPPLQYLLSYQPLSFVDMSAAVLYGIVSMFVIELGKTIFFKYRTA